MRYVLAMKIGSFAPLVSRCYCHETVRSVLQKTAENTGWTFEPLDWADGEALGIISRNGQAIGHYRLGAELSPEDLF